MLGSDDGGRIMKDYEPILSFGDDDAARYDDSSRGDEEATVAFLEQLARGGPALELAIGTGRIALPLAARGIPVDGIDFSPAMVARLRANLRAIAGFLRPDAGRIALEDGKPDCPLSEQCHYVGHLNAVKASLSVGENAGFWCGFLGGAHDRVEPALATFGLQPLRDIPAGDPSAGQRRRLGLARLLLAERPVWLLDEPTASLDDGAQRKLTAVVNRHLGAGGLVFAATHLPLELASARELRLGGVAQAA